MIDNTTAEDKSVVAELNFGAKTAKRVGWESWEFSVAGPHQIEVTNASWGFQKDDHSYIVGIEERDGVVTPAECGYKVDRYREDYDCKHKVTLASVGGPVVLQAAVAYAPSTETGEGLRSDGGAVSGENEDSHRLHALEHDECAHGEEWCDGPDCNDFPCFACFERTENHR